MLLYTMYSALRLYGRLYNASFKISLARINAINVSFILDGYKTKLNFTDGLPNKGKAEDISI